MANGCKCPFRQSKKNCSKCENSEQDITNDYSDFVKRMNCSKLLIQSFLTIANACADGTTIKSEKKLMCGIYNKYCAVYFNDRAFALSLAFDYFEGYHFVLSIYNDGSSVDIYKKISDKGYRYRTEQCYQKEIWIDIILDKFLLTNTDPNSGSASEIAEIIGELGLANQK